MEVDCAIQHGGLAVLNLRKRSEPCVDVQNRHYTCSVVCLGRVSQLDRSHCLGGLLLSLARS